MTVIFTGRVVRQSRVRSLNRYLTRHLRLVSMDQSRIVETDESNTSASSSRLPSHHQRVGKNHKFKRRIRELTGRSRGISMKRRMSELRSYLRGWIGYFGLAAQLKGGFDRLVDAGRAAWVTTRFHAAHRADGQ
jgi:RNA-directed DNA polymerase